ncbi:MAG: hypothetical protein AAGC78_20135 [Cellvibrio sp.]|uniref:hypothetical protein n=1 Tax=Cellvibrio sp. TaxID=1965322 RepID=UPI0031A21420
MSLLDVQRSMVEFARGYQRECRKDYNLTRAESEWLDQLPQAQGLKVTQQTQQWWRITRLCSAAPLTVELIKRSGLEELLYDYIINQPVRSLFFAAELEQFAQYLQRHSDSSHNIKTLAAFEYAIKHAYQTSVSNGDWHSSPVQTLHFTCDPIKLFSALLTGGELPEHTRDYYLIVSPDLPNYWRLALESEYQLTNPSAITAHNSLRIN